MKTKFFEINQNNTGGSFVTDNNLCHRLFIEADSESEAKDIAENLGCYWDGVDDGMDCPCCGDRWYLSGEISFNDINDRWGGYDYSRYINNKSEKIVLEEVKSKYPNARWSVEPSVIEKYGSKQVSGKMVIDSVEQYAQVLADLYGWTTPDCRIFYKDGSVKEIFSDKVNY